MPFSSGEDFLRRAGRRLLPLDAAPATATRSDFDLMAGPRPPQPDAYVQAAVLIGLSRRGDDLLALLTLRPESMARHAGQVAFPGGRVDPNDPSALAAALREANEEVGLDPRRVQLIGQGDPYITSTGYLVSPFVGLLPDGFEPAPDPREVAEVFETPMSFLMRPENHERHERTFGGQVRAYYAMPHNGRYIWGATAGMIKALYDRVYGDQED